MRTRTLSLGVSVMGAVMALACAALTGLDALTTSGIDWDKIARNTGMVLACGFGVSSASGIVVGLPLFLLFSFAVGKPAGDTPPTPS